MIEGMISHLHSLKIYFGTKWAIKNLSLLMSNNLKDQISTLWGWYIPDVCHNRTQLGELNTIIKSTKNMPRFYIDKKYEGSICALKYFLMQI